MQFYKLIVSNIIQETADTVTLVLAVPADLREQFSYRSGQYLTLQFMIGGKEERRAYSMSSSPHEADIAVTVKAVKGGKVSNYIQQKLVKGSEVSCMTPQGRFVVVPDASVRRTYYLLGAGSGITPLMSILKHVLEAEPMSTVNLLYGSRDVEGIIFRKQLDDLARHYEGQLNVVHTLSQTDKKGSFSLGGLFGKKVAAPPIWAGRKGRIDEACVAWFIEEYPNHHPSAAYYLCGPGGMIEAAEKALAKHGVATVDIHKEYFTNDSSAAAKPMRVSDGAHMAIVHLNGERIELEIPAGKTILDALVREKYDAPYSCMSGACSTCMAKLIAGEVSMDVCLALDPSEINDGYILTCQARPLSSVVELKF